MKLVKNNGKEIILIIVSFLVGGLFMLGLVAYTPLINHNYIITKNGTQIYEKGSLSASVEKIYDAVVVVQNYSHGELDNSGTGFVYKIDEKYAYILTNEHVISDAEKITIITVSEEEVTPTVLGRDAYLDLAVLRIDKRYANLVATIGSSEKMNLGDTVFTVGSPLGYNYRGSVTAGVLSGKDRMVSTSTSNSDNADWVVRVLQIDASINPGNSGGPLLNINGEVIGICSLKLIKDNIEGMGFAIPIEYAMSHVKTLEAGEEIKWPVLGIGMVNVSDKAGLINKDIQITKNMKEGVVVTNVKEATGASKAGLQKGDIIIELAGVKVKDIAHLRYELYQHQKGDTIAVTYIRNDKKSKVNVVLN